MMRALQTVPPPPKRSARSAVHSVLPPPQSRILEQHPPKGAEFTFLEFFSYFPHVPTALAIKECVRLKRMKELPVIGPVLDVGCGDGLFTSLAYPEVDAWGIDVNEREAARAQASRAYRQVLCQSVTDGETLPAHFFSTCIANCSLEHVPDIQAALRNICGALKRGGLFYLIVPKSEWTRTLPINRTLRRIGLGDVANAYGAALDGQFAHHHLYEPERWIELLTEAGFVDIEHEPLGSDGSQRAFEAWLVPSVAGYVNKVLTGRWVIAERTRKLYAWPVFKAVQRIVQAEPGGPGAETLLVCRAGRA